MEKFIKLEYKEVETKKISDYESSFSVSPLERGLANTLGNALRRTLLSSVTGVAPVAVKIEGASHEFQTLKGIKEDVIQLILNLKTIRFEYSDEIFKEEELVKVTIDTDGPIVTAKDILAPTGVRVINVDHHIATVSKGSSFKAEVFLTVGRGFNSFENNKVWIKTRAAKFDSKLSGGALIAVDSDFSPVVNVSYESRELNTASPVIQEKLTLDIKTDGSMEAKDALSQAASILIAHMSVIADVENIEKEDFFNEIKDEEATKQIKPISIAAMDLSVRSYNCLKRAGYENLEDLATLNRRTLSTIKNLGKKSVEEIIKKLEEHGVFIDSEGEE